ERRKSDIRKADARRSAHGADPNRAGSESPASVPLWLIQAMLINIVYGHNCADKTASDIASTHCVALVSLAQAADLLRPNRADASAKQDVQMSDDSSWTRPPEQEAHHQEWLQWKTTEE